MSLRFAFAYQNGQFILVRAITIALQHVNSYALNCGVGMQGVLQLFAHEEPGLIKHWAANPPAASYLQTF